MKTNDVQLSKFLSLLLRHKPETIGLNLDVNGWANIDELIELSEKRGKHYSHDIIRHIVETNDKKRFIISDDGMRIRANQGHSINVDVELKAMTPPERLYHGTATRFLKNIMAQGLMSGSRQHVHLSADLVTAKKVGMRHGVPVILEVDTLAMADDGMIFFCSENNVWLTEHVKPRYLRQLD
ncbi:RNA 2'-phosphotransferase [Pleionea sp. CnH1-48]|uniref:RNA 2'-phosphotransferase n=1 Tax=Pleionea sp. CnH1-48 TaxID=2954494 RepID=UPI002096A6F8|nr:RNA 2'-phosphotransferase [Pleionea sp. CnH1-48]MCO7226738.1 RNA 2'-phosphotransferase [Pleionea sp. CnH1-48]